MRLSTIFTKYPQPAYPYALVKSKNKLKLTIINAVTNFGCGSIEDLTLLLDVAKVYSLGNVKLSTSKYL